jgi:hypothetical protein
MLSPESLVSCDKKNKGCKGGFLTVSFDYIKKEGLVDTDCLPFKEGKDC